MAIEYEFLPLDQDEMPVSKLFTVENAYTFLYRINARHSRIYCEIRDVDDNVIYTTRLVYAGELIHAVVDGLDIGDNTIIPFNIDDLLTDAISDDSTVQPDNLDRVKQYVVTG
jgi:hypothetical protein